ncbi:MAG: alpha/beta fold hydrolase [Acidimicrobiia bacterium]
MHSLLTGPEAYDQVARALRDRFTVHRVYLPGFGRSTPPATDLPPTISDLADRVALTMLAIGCGKDTTVFGNGLGAFVALSVAVRHGSSFDRVIASNVGATFSTERKRAFVTMSELAESGGMESVADIAVKRIFPASYLEAHPDALADRRTVLEQVDASAFSRACISLAELDLSRALPSVGNPLMVIAGEIDKTTPPEMAKDVAELVPNSRLVVIPDCGHCPQLEQPRALLEVIGSFTSTR